MAKFTVRVELHAANADDYDVPHGAMEGAGFSRQISSDAGVSYHLPWAEYNIEDSLDKSQVCDKANAAAQDTGKSFAILVTESNGRTWIGLERA